MTTTSQKVDLPQRLRDLGTAYNQAHKDALSGKPGAGGRMGEIAHRIVTTLPAVLHALANLPVPQEATQSVPGDAFDGYEWGVEADTEAGKHVMGGEATARALVQVTPIALKPKLYRRPVGPWEEVPER